MKGQIEKISQERNAEIERSLVEMELRITEGAASLNFNAACKLDPILVFLPQMESHSTRR